MSTRDDNLKKLSDMLTTEQFAVILEKNYSDKVLDLIAEYNDNFAATFADTKYKPETVEKLEGLLGAGKLDFYDMRELMEDSRSHNRNERYIDTFAETVNQENYYDTYAVFRTTNVTDVSFDDMYLGIHQGAYEANSFGMVQMNRDLAREMNDLGISLLICEEYDYYSDLLDFEDAYNENTYTFVPVQKHRLTCAINDIFRQPDWSGFKDYLKAQLGDNMDKLTPYILNDMWTKYHEDLSMNKLADKVADEYDRFIKDIKQQPADRIVEAAYEIVQKDDIREFCSGADFTLSQEELDDLLTADNLLDRLYNKWDEMTDLHSLYDYDIVFEETASDLKAERQERERTAEKVEQKCDDIPNNQQKHAKKRGGAR